MTDKTDERLPEIGEYVRRTGRLLRIEDPRPEPPPKKDWIFEYVNARKEVRLNGKALNKLGTLNDYYGQGTAVPKAIAEAQDWCEDNCVVQESTLEVVVVKVVSHVRMRPVRDVYDRSIRFQSIDNGCKWKLPADVETVVWSSKTGEVVE
jgi:hypothetical protein